MFETLLIHKRGTNSGKLDFFCSALTRLAILIVATFSDLFDKGIIKTLIEASFTIFHCSMGYWMKSEWHKPCIVKNVYGKEDLRGTGYKDKGECDLSVKKIEDKGDANLRISCKSWDEMIRGFVLEKEDKDGGGAETWTVFDKGIASRGGDNFVLLMYQYQVIIG